MPPGVWQASFGLCFEASIEHQADSRLRALPTYPTGIGFGLEKLRFDLITKSVPRHRNLNSPLPFFFYPTFFKLIGYAGFRSRQSRVFLVALKASGSNIWCLPVAFRFYCGEERKGVVH